MADSDRSPEPAPATTDPATATPETAEAVPASPPAGILPASHWAQEPLPEEQRDDEADSAFGDTASTTASLGASILEYRTIHGRTYHSEIGKAQSWTPNDEQQTESMDIHHHMCTLALDGKLYRAPLKEGIAVWPMVNMHRIMVNKHPRKPLILDVAQEFGQYEFPECEVIGTDLSPIQPNWVPPNLEFQLDDANQDWTWPDDTFDYIHMRAMFGSIVDWEALYREAFRCCKPGGYFEDYENSIKIDSDDGSVVPGSPFDQWTKVFWEGGNKFGRTFRVVEDDIQKKYMEEAGFVDVTVWDFKCPIGSWPSDPKLREIGQYAKLVLESDVEGYVLYMWNAVMGWSREETQVFIAHLRRQLRDRNVHSWYRHRVVYGRKPE